MRTRAWSGVVAAGLAGCAAHGPSSLPPGATLDQATALMGVPTARHRLSAGERLEFARGPAGLHTYMLDFDAQGRLIKIDQVLDEAHFDAVPLGLDGEALRRTLGRPTAADRSADGRHRMLSWRYDATFCRRFVVLLDAQGRVEEKGYGPDPVCEVRD